MTEEQPRARENPLHLDFKDSGVAINATVHFASFERNQFIYLGICKGHLESSFNESAPPLKFSFLLNSRLPGLSSRTQPSLSASVQPGAVTENLSELRSGVAIRRKSVAEPSRDLSSGLHHLVCELGDSFVSHAD